MGLAVEALGVTGTEEALAAVAQAPPHVALFRRINKLPFVLGSPGAVVPDLSPRLPATWLSVCFVWPVQCPLLGGLLSTPDGP